MSTIRSSIAVQFAVAALAGCAERATAPLPPVAPLTVRAAAGVEYTVTDLGTLGGPYSYANAVGIDGRVVGSSQIASGEWRAFLWHDGVMTNLGTLSTGQFTDSRASGINARGQVVGSSLTGGPTHASTHAFLWDKGVMTDLGVVTETRDISPNGDVVGTVVTTGSLLRAFLWRAGTMTNLGTLGGPQSSAYAINARGQVVGLSEIRPGQWHAFVWYAGVMIDLGTLGGWESRAYDISPSGDVVGSSTTTAGEQHAFLWTKGEMTDLGTLGGSFSVAYAINARGQIVGFSETSDGAVHAFLWDRGVMTDIGASLGNSSSAYDIDPSGRFVVGSMGRYPVGQHAALWTLK